MHLLAKEKTTNEKNCLTTVIGFILQIYTIAGTAVPSQQTSALQNSLATSKPTADMLPI
jgi:hypothetical protein